MNDRDMSVRDAGRLIASSGLTDDVIQARGEQITNRRGRQREEAGDVEERSAPRRRREDDEDDAPRAKKPKPRREPEPDDHDYGDGDTFGGEDDDEAEGSTRESGEHEGDEEDDAEPADEGDEAEGDDQERPDPVEGEHVVKVNGEEFVVTTKELVTGYQRGRDYQQKTQHLAAKGRELTEGHGKVAEVYARKLQALGSVHGALRQMLIGDVDSTEMQALLQRDPQAWQVQRTLMQDRISKVDQVLEALNQEHERHVGEYTKQQKANLAHTIGQEMAIVERHIPDWQTKGKERLGKYLMDTGFTNAELVNVTDSRMLIVADKARKWDAYLASKKQAPTRKLKPAPKSVKSGQGQIRKGGSQTAVKRNDYRRDADRAKKTGDMRDAGRAIRHLL